MPGFSLDLHREQDDTSNTSCKRNRDNDTPPDDYGGAFFVWQESSTPSGKQGKFRKSQKAQVAAHERHEHEDVTCGKACASERKLSGHVPMHTEERRFRRLKCGKAFAQSGDLTKHVQAHAGCRLARSSIVASIGNPFNGSPCSGWKSACCNRGKTTPSFTGPRLPRVC